MSRGLVLADGEQEVVSSPAKLLGRTRTLDSTSEESASADHALEAIDEGDLVQTDRRVTFLGQQQVVEVHFSDLVAWHLEGAVLRIHAGQHPEPYLFGLDEAPDVLHMWTDHVEDPTAVLDPGDDGRWIQPGFPKRILLDDEERVVDADPLLPFAAALLDTWPNAGLVDAQQLAKALGISDARATTMLSQLEALGFTSRPDADGERAVFDPDDLTTPLGDLDAARRDDADPAGSPRQT